MYIHTMAGTDGSHQIHDGKHKYLVHKRARFSARSILFTAFSAYSSFYSRCIEFLFLCRALTSPMSIETFATVCVCVCLCGRRSYWHMAANVVCFRWLFIAVMHHTNYIDSDKYLSIEYQMGAQFTITHKTFKFNRAKYSQPQQALWPHDFSHSDAPQVYAS